MPLPERDPPDALKRECRHAFAPANGSLIFETYEATPDHGRGSLGVGFTLDAGVTASVERLAVIGEGAARARDALDSRERESDGRDFGEVAQLSEIRVHGNAWEFPTVRQVVSRLAPEPVRIDLRADLPFGCGFGMSGAGALASAYALGSLFDEGRPLRDLALVAHEAEVDNATGRGDVGGQFNGGFMVKTKVGAPLDVDWLPIGETSIWCRIFGPISTREVLRDAGTMARVNAAGRAALDHLRAHPAIDLEALLEISRRFAEESGLLTSPRVRASIDDALAAGGQASMVMLGEAVVSSVPIPRSTAYRVVRRPARPLSHADDAGDAAGSPSEHQIP